MARLRFTTVAYQDLNEIMRYISAHNPPAALRLTDQIEAECWRLARNPAIGQLRPDLAPGLRFFPVANYLIFYREWKEEIQIIRVIHGSRDYGVTDF